ncbi:MAG: RNA polymerase sigma-70 factor [Pedobacter sp.]|nr:RNA polymerase sigma-70 factor [Pedobacter sp.]MDQ8052214.1 RNA polymerase sigma-70 factor [Pedobacter sp.]
MTSSPLYDDRELLKRIAHGDERAFEIIYHRYTKKIYFFGLKTLHSPLLAEEVVQEVMLKLWRMGPMVVGINQLEAYLRTTSRNIALNMLRRQAVENRASQLIGQNWEEEINETEEQILLNDSRKILNEAIALLPQQQRMVYKLCQEQGLKYDEAAEKLNLAPSTVATHMKLALRFVRNYLQKNAYSAIILIIFKLL